MAAGTSVTTILIRHNLIPFATLIQFEQYVKTQFFNLGKPDAETLLVLQEENSDEALKKVLLTTGFLGLRAGKKH